MSCEGLYSAMLGRMLSMSNAFRALPRLPCAPPPRLDGYEALMRCHSALEPSRASRARAVAMVFVEDLRGLTPSQRSEALTGHAGHAPLMSDEWAIASASAWADYATLLAVLVESPTPAAALLHMAQAEPGAFWTQVWRWLLMQHASYMGGGHCHDDERVAHFPEWLCACVVARAHPGAPAWALFQEERRRCESLGLLLDLPEISRLLANLQIHGDLTPCRALRNGSEPSTKRGRSAPSAI